MQTYREQRLIEKVGRELYGSDWCERMSAELDINLRTVQRWRSGVLEPWPDVWRELRDLLMRELSEEYASLDKLPSWTLAARVEKRLAELSA